jgi:DNA-binding response OmpR family regulator
MKSNERHALVIDDDEGITELAAIWLQQAGWKVQTTLEGKEDLALSHSVKPDVILCDTHMPGLHGAVWNFARWSRVRRRSAMASGILNKKGIKC